MKYDVPHQHRRRWRSRQTGTVLPSDYGRWCRFDHPRHTRPLPLCRHPASKHTSSPSLSTISTNRLSFQTDKTAKIKADYLKNALHSLFVEIIKTFWFFGIFFMSIKIQWLLGETQPDGADTGDNNPTKPHSNTVTLVKTDHFTLKWLFSTEVERKHLVTTQIWQRLKKKHKKRILHKRMLSCSTKIQI